jgi:uncharacterized protein YgfB (UPF0149 family)
MEPIAVNKDDLIWPDFDTLEHRLIAANTPFSPAYIHGIMMGLLCVATRQPLKSWQFLQAELPVLAQEKATNELFNALFSMTSNQLQEIDHGVMLMLPTDDLPLSYRLEALSAWCEGFLDGVKLENLPAGTFSQLPLVTEVLEDLSHIQDISFDAIDSETNEKDYTEIVEFVRVGVLVVHAECQQANISHRPLH